MTSNLVWIDHSNETPEQAIHIRAQAARDWRRRQREERGLAAARKAGKLLPGPPHNQGDGNRRLVLKPKGKTERRDWHEAERHSTPDNAGHYPCGDANQGEGSPKWTLGPRNASHQQQTHRHEWVVFSTNALPMSIGRSDLPIVLMTNVFAEGYFTTDAYRIPAVTTRHLTWLQARNRSMEEAIYTIGLLQIGSGFHNDNIAYEARRHYGLMLQSFRSDLKTPEKDFTAVVATILEIMLTQVYNTVAGDTLPWRTHILWMTRLVKQSGTELLSSPIGHILYETSCMLELVHSLVVRRSFKLNVSYWMEIKSSREPGGLAQLFSLAASLPALLQNTDRATASNTSLDNLRPLGSQLLDLERSLVRWFDDYGKQATRHLKDELVTFNVDPGPSSKDLPLPSLSPTFREELYFRSHHAANIHSLYWHCLLQLRIAIQQIKPALEAAPDFDEFWLIEQRDFNAESCACANLLCRSIPYLLRTAGGNISQTAAVRLPIYFAKDFFSGSSEYQPEFEWCSKAEAMLRGHFPEIHFDDLLPWSLLALIWQPFEPPEVLQSSNQVETPAS